MRAAPYTTEDVDIARKEPLDFDKPLERALLDMLKDSGIPFVEVPPLDRKKASTSFKEVGRLSFHVDLLVPSRDDTFPTVAVPERRAHAIGLPYLRAGAR